MMTYFISTDRSSKPKTSKTAPLKSQLQSDLCRLAEMFNELSTELLAFSQAVDSTTLQCFISDLEYRIQALRNSATVFTEPSQKRSKTDCRQSFRDSIARSLPVGVREMVYAYLPPRVTYLAMIQQRSFFTFLKRVTVYTGVEDAIDLFWGVYQTEIQACITPQVAASFWGSLLAEACITPEVVSHTPACICAADAATDYALSGLRDLAVGYLSQRARLVSETVDGELVVSDVNFNCFRALKLLASFPALSQLDLSGTLTIDLSPVSGLLSLEVLVLSNTLVRDISSLTGLSRLRELDLRTTRLTDFQPLSRLTGMSRLWLSRTVIDDLSPLSPLVNLEEIDLSFTFIRDLRPISHLVLLKRLWLSSTLLDDISPLMGMLGLQLLDLSKTRVADLESLSGLTELRILWLLNTPVRDVTPIEGLFNLEQLSVAHTSVDDLRPLANLRGLDSLDIGPMDDSELSVLSNLVDAGLQIFRSTRV